MTQSKSYDSEGHKDRCAQIGLLVSRVLEMSDASPKEVEAKIRDMASGLRTIAMLAQCDVIKGVSRLEAMSDIYKQAKKPLEGEYRTNHDQESADTLERLVSLTEKLSRKDAMEAAVKIYRSLHSGGCRVLSEGESCDCFLCQVQRWVEEHAG